MIRFFSALSAPALAEALLGPGAVLTDWHGDTGDYADTDIAHAYATGTGRLCPCDGDYPDGRRLFDLYTDRDVSAVLASLGCEVVDPEEVIP